MNEKTAPRIVIIGGVAGGASAAARARRLSERAQITLLERGPDVSFANCGLPYHIGGEIADRERLAVQTPGSLREMLAVDVRVRTEAIDIDRARREVRIRNLDTNEEAALPYDKLILSPGASPLCPPLEGISHPRIYTLRNLQDMDRIREAASQASSALVIGAGFIGLEMAEQLVHLDKRVSLIELAEQVLPQMDREMVYAAEAALRTHGVDLRLADGIEGFADVGGKVQACLKSGRTLEADMAILSIGVRPESALAKEAGLNLGPRGHIHVNAFQQTSDADIYAVGDVCETTDPILGGPTAIPLGGPANRQGRVAADHIFDPDHARPYPGSIGTAIVRVFEVAAGVTGHTEKRLQQLGVAFEKTIVTDFDHASYYPGATHVTVKILWEKATGRLLGGQAFGSNGIDKRLDVLATAIKGRLTVDDLEHLELAYAPPFGAAKDPLNIAGFSANNVRDGRFKPVYALPEEGSMQVLDVRPAASARLNSIAGAINIALPELRARLGELDKRRPVVAFCGLGKTSYFAARILQEHGFDAYAHVGGLKVLPSTSSQQTPEKRIEKMDTSSGVLKLDATGIACPGPIMRVKERVEVLAVGQVLEITASDSGFASDLPAFCKANELEFLGTEQRGGLVVGRLRKSASALVATSGGSSANGATVVLFSGEMDKAMAAFIVANGAVAMGGQATIFFTFWGLNVLRKDQAATIPEKTLMERLLSWILPRGVGKLPLSKMHMWGLGTRMMSGRMRAKALPDLAGLMRDACDNGVRLVACGMSMEAMGLRREELIEGVEIGGVADYLGAAKETHANLFI